jgi:hypothetical protein
MASKSTASYILRYRQLPKWCEVKSVINIYISFRSLHLQSNPDRYPENDDKDVLGHPQQAKVFT